MNIKKNISLIIFLISNLCFGQNQTITIDKIAAQIGENIILMSDIQSQITQETQSGTPIDALTDCLVLEDLLFQNLLLHQAKFQMLKLKAKWKVDLEL